MERGDLSDWSPIRWIITLDSLTDGDLPRPKRGRFSRPVNWQKAANELELPVLVLGKLFQFTSKVTVQFECVVFGLPQEFCDALEERLDRMGVHPLRWITSYEQREELQAMLPFRPEVQAVIDVPENALSWGHLAMTLDDLNLTA